MNGSIVFAMLCQCASSHNTCFVSPPGHNPESWTKTSFLSVRLFLHSSLRCPYTSQWAALSPLKIAPSHGGIWTPSNNGSLGSPESSPQTAPRSMHPFLQGSIVWQTDHATQLVTIGRICVHSCQFLIDVQNSFTVAKSTKFLCVHVLFARSCHQKTISNTVTDFTQENMHCRVDLPYSLWLPYVIGQTNIFWPWILSFFFFSSPNLSRRRLDVYHTWTHGVALVRI